MSLTMLGSALAGAQQLAIDNPYRNQGRWWKGQLHAHSRRSDGRLPARQVVERYLEAGYAFVSLTDHRNIRDYWFDGPTSCELARTNPAPDLPITVIPGLELGQPPHFAYIGFPERGICHPAGAQLPEDVGKFLCWIREKGGLAIAAHPMTGERNPRKYRKRRWGREQMLAHAAPRGCLMAMEIGSLSDLAMWDALWRDGRRVWGVLTDDSHQRREIDQRGFVMVNVAQDEGPPERAAVLASLRAGDFYSVRHGHRGRGRDLPAFESIEAEEEASGRWAVRAAVSGAAVYRCIYGDRPASAHGVCRSELSHACVEEVLAGGTATAADVASCMQPLCEARCPAAGGLDGSEGYVRIELENLDRAIAYSQPIRVRRAGKE